jgi:hypothetical protein
MSCPSRKQIIDYLYSGTSEKSGMGQHLHSCPACQNIVQEEETLTEFFRNHFKAEEPNPFLWSRIESRLSDAPVKAAGIRLSPFLPRPVVALVASVALVALVCGAFLMRNQEPSREAMLAAIDSQYSQTLNLFEDLEHNPFNGRLNPVSSKDQNPFVIVETTVSEPDSGENPFQPFNPSQAIDYRR